MASSRHSRRQQPRRPGTLISALPCAALLFGSLGCETNYFELPAEDSGAGGQAALLEGAPEADTQIGDQQLELFEATGNSYWFAVPMEQVSAMNTLAGFDDGFPGGGFGDIYTPGEGEGATYAEHLFVSTAGARGQTADYGKVQVRLLGQSTGRAWSERSLPNLKVDSDEFVPGMRIGGYEHVRFNNGLVGSILREKLALDLYHLLDYPAPLATYAWVGSNVWGPGLHIPYTLVEVYKRPFCERYADEFAGGCVNMWEFAGDLGSGILSLPESCQLGECDNTRAEEFEALAVATPPGEGFKEALADWVDWDSYHRFQCISWILATSDDPLHALNNLVLIERGDGRFQYLPYSVDISLGQEFSFDVPLTGMNVLSRGCQADPTCWADTIASCETTIADFQAADPVSLLEDVYATLEAQDMLRSGDEGRYELLRNWFEERVEALPDMLEPLRELPEACLEPFVDCNGACLLPEECFGGCGPVFPLQQPAHGGPAADAVIAPCPILEAYAVE